MQLRSIFLPVAIAFVSVSAFASDANNFVLVSSSNGKVIGKAGYSISKAKENFKVHSHFEYRMSTALLPKRPEPAPVPGQEKPYRPAMMMEGQFAGEYTVDAQGNYVTGFIVDSTSNAMTSYSPNKARNNINVSETQAGSVGNARDIEVPSPNFIFMPEFDPAALQVLMTAEIAHPHGNDPYLLVVPGGVMTYGGNVLLYVTIEPAKDTRTGTLDGKPVTLKHYILLFHAGRAEVFVDDSGNLMDAQFGPLGVDYIRSKFVLAP
jgi:hypothetical protein